MRFLSTIATLSMLIVPAVTINASVAQAGSNLQFVQAQNSVQFQSRNSSRRGGPSSFGAIIGGTERVCCTTYTHGGGWTGCATYQTKHCPDHARFTPPPNNDPVS